MSMVETSGAAAANLPVAPPDQSGGILTIGYGDGFDEHRLDVHVRPFTTTVPTSSPYAWTYTTAAGSEASVAATASNLIALLRQFYDATWAFWVEGLKRVSSGEIVPVFPLPVPSGTLTGGSGGSAIGSDNPARFTYTQFDLTTAFGGRMRLRLTAADQNALQRPVACTPTAGGYGTGTDYRNVVAYLTGANCAIVGHDGHQAVGSAKLVTDISDTLRVKYGFA